VWDRQTASFAGRRIGGRHHAKCAQAVFQRDRYRCAVRQAVGESDCTLLMELSQLETGRDRNRFPDRGGAVGLVGIAPADTHEVLVRDVARRQVNPGHQRGSGAAIQFDRRVGGGKTEAGGQLRDQARRETEGGNTQVFNRQAERGMADDGADVVGHSKQPGQQVRAMHTFVEQRAATGQ